MNVLPPTLRPERVRALVFDLDGTLVDSYSAIATSLNHVRAAYGLPPVPLDEVRRSVGHGLDSLIARYVGADRVEDGIARFRSRYAEVFRAETTALPGALEAVRELRARGFRLSIASNKPADFTERIVEELGIRAAFDAVRGPEPSVPPKPAPAMILGCLRAMGAGANESAYVGDMVLDVESAARAGVAAILVCGGSSTEADLRATGQPVVGRLTELLDLLAAREPPGV